MSSIQDSTDLSVIFRSLRQRLTRYLPQSSEKAQITLQSSALAQITYATLKNIPYALLSKEFGINDLGHMLSSRVTYLEALVIALASTVCNIAFAALYTALSIATLGISNSVNFSMLKHWHHVKYGLASTGIGLLGVLTPYNGVRLNAFLLYVTVNTMRNCYGHDVRLFDRPLLNEIKDIMQNYSHIITNYTRARAKDGLRWEENEKQSLEYIEREIQKAKKMEQLIALALKARAEWPNVGSQENRSPSSTSNKRKSKAIHNYYGWWSS